MIHYFLTGEQQVGKSTIIDKVIKNTGARVGGFRTAFGPDRFSAEYKFLYMRDAAEEFVPDAEHAIARFSPEGIMPFTARFESSGLEIVNRALTEKPDIIILDECGRLESEALNFQEAVISTLDSGIPVLGVIPKRIPPWTRKMIYRDDVKVLEVTVENRNRLAVMLTGEYMPYVRQK
ncbi:MAG: nucleoside-triphosphatase [Clostridia bacterium]|nr:nucleoside-triphosphatase [Clostridia bacterium]